MEKKNISRIIKKFLSGRFHTEAEERVQKWIIKEDDAREKEEASLEYWNELEVEINSDTYSALKRVNKRIGHFERNKILPHRKLARIAAVFILLLFVAGCYLYFNSTRSEMIEISVAYGENKHFFLPDSSTIWLNAGTTLKYPKEFKGNKRQVYLDGEAYFEVSENKKKPFIVLTEHISIKVLGTKFNVKAYSSDAKATAALTSGKVEVNTQSKVSQILKPNERLTYNAIQSTINVEEVLPEETDAWVTGKLLFVNSSFKDIKETLERRFDITFEDKTDVPASKLYTVKFFKGENENEILNVLKDVVGFTYRQQGRNIVLKSKQ